METLSFQILQDPYRDLPFLHKFPNGCHSWSRSQMSVIWALIFFNYLFCWKSKNKQLVDSLFCSQGMGVIDWRQVPQGTVPVLNKNPEQTLNAFCKLKMAAFPGINIERSSRNCGGGRAFPPHTHLLSLIHTQTALIHHAKPDQPFQLCAKQTPDKPLFA